MDYLKRKKSRLERTIKVYVVALCVRKAQLSLLVHLGDHTLEWILWFVYNSSGIIFKPFYSADNSHGRIYLHTPGGGDARVYT